GGCSRARLAGAGQPGRCRSGRTAAAGGRAAGRHRSAAVVAAAAGRAAAAAGARRWRGADAAVVAAAGPARGAADAAVNNTCQSPLRITLDEQKQPLTGGGGLASCACGRWGKARGEDVVVRRSVGSFIYSYENARACDSEAVATGRVFVDGDKGPFARGGRVWSSVIGLVESLGGGLIARVGRLGRMGERRRVGQVVGQTETSSICIQ
ncbi:hypothetical protein V494_04699, partial [Pseudogymnoascus sp. VKM F-4513 (FW-928)]